MKAYFPEGVANTDAIQAHTLAHKPQLMKKGVWGTYSISFAVKLVVCSDSNE